MAILDDIIIVDIINDGDENMIKYKSEIEMFGVSIKPHYARKQYTVVDHAKREVRKAQRIHYSYNVPAIIHVYEKEENGDWRLIQQVEIPAS